MRAGFFLPGFEEPSGENMQNSSLANENFNYCRARNVVDRGLEGAKRLTCLKTRGEVV
jgi:hypothetical protein